MERVKVAVLGGSGYTAGELLELLLRHPGAEIAAVSSREETRAAAPLVSDLHPRLRGRLDLACETLTADDCVQRGIQCVFGCLPHGASAAAIGPLLDRLIRVIDLSADYRLSDPSIYAEWYGHPHGDLGHLPWAVYGLPELFKDKLPAARLVANPGCYPQSAILGLAPLLHERLIDLASIIIDSKSGVSGAGRNPSPTTHFPECNESVAAYNVGRHRHTPEIEQLLTHVAGQPVQALFTPHLIPMDRGLFSTLYAQPTRPVTEGDLLLLYRRFYADAPFVRIGTRLPSTKDTLRTNYCDLVPRVVRDRIVVLSCLDNLRRGASGVAVQNFNLMFGFPETTALD
ncbi:MAG TPA: N-acetyl-gamma-glutamyl-phosphate reductase [Gemmatales bacterium]|nr:N-acetyl-gamma-glutamyl-phosphate reductase [Gemmatales bacterium]HMP59332.1 N-acetyl-gamma-glutamyl-phosphate reductase [Gemmatales bacterium]